MTADIHHATARDLANRVTARTLSAAEVAQAMCARTDSDRLDT